MKETAYLLQGALISVWWVGLATDPKGQKGTGKKRTSPDIPALGKSDCPPFATPFATPLLLPFAWSVDDGTERLAMMPCIDTIDLLQTLSR